MLLLKTKTLIAFYFLFLFQLANMIVNKIIFSQQKIMLAKLNFLDLEMGIDSDNKSNHMI